MFLIISLKCWRYFVNVTPDGNIACTRKAIPGTRLLASQAILAAGGLIHRAGCAETHIIVCQPPPFSS
ncbi:putative pyrophosphorylase [Escherichia coli]|uniref:Putative pyrophosphorylase n=1 Tax=Escherichia coli TaxID=562 RepID=A0A377K7L0_ECOLX|nr:putative pyrophosphorylase [Escherichia coli]